MCDEHEVVVVPFVVVELKKQASDLDPQATLSELADVHDVNRAHVPTFGVVVLVPGVKAHAPSDPPPKQASLAVYDEQVD